MTLLVNTGLCDFAETFAVVKYNLFSFAYIYTEQALPRPKWAADGFEQAELRGAAA